MTEAESELLNMCIASGQVDASQLVKHEEAGDMEGTVDIQERERFEAWGNEHMLMGIDAPSWDAGRNCYIDPSVHYMWKAWQAALAASSSVREETRNAPLVKPQPCHCAGVETGAKCLPGCEEPGSVDITDTERMGWIESAAHALVWQDYRKIVVKAEDGATFTGESWRDAIDAAIHTEAGKP